MELINYHFKQHMRFIGRSKNYLQDICVPIMDLGFGYFHYARLYDSGNFAIITTDSDFHGSFWDKKLHGEVFPTFRPGIYLDNLTKPVLAQTYHDSGINQLVRLIKRNSSYLEMFVLAAIINKDSTIDAFNKYQFQIAQFIPYFKTKAAQLINESIKFGLSTPYQHTINTARTSEFSALKTYYVETGGDAVAITRTEFMTWQLYVKGMTAREICYQRSLSRRTIEDHVRSLKTKLKCSSRAQLVELYYMNYIDLGLLLG